MHTTPVPLRRIAAAATLDLLAGAAQANIVSWRVQGVLSTAEGTDLPGFINVGDSFSFLLQFDAAAAVTNPGVCGDGGVGRRCNFFGVAGLSFGGITIDGVDLGTFQSSEQGLNFIFQRNNTAPPENPTSDVRVDGITIGGQDQYFDDISQRWRSTQMSTIFRGPENLNVVTDARVLPTTPPPGLLDLGLRVWQVCDLDPEIGQCDRLLVHGAITSVVAVPEPGTYALMALGLAAVGAVARRRRA